MEISQKDRDSLRRAQQKLNTSSVIGNIVEHNIQDPVKYKSLSRQEQNLSYDSRPSLPTVNYKSAYLDEAEEHDERHKLEDWSNSAGESLPTISETEERLQLPISIEDVQANQWLNMDRVEYDKLEWMSEKSERIFQEKLKSSTHFDSEGHAVPPGAADNIPHDQKPVHDIGSLVKLLDSMYQPQVTYSLNVISKIATLATNGLYDGSFDENILEILLRECLCRVRAHIDSPNESICQSALKCLRSLVCNVQVDEIFLDRMHPLKCQQINASDWLRTIEMASQQFTIETTDRQCAEIDAILTLIERTDILRRFTYLLQVKSEPFSAIYKDCILDILIRFARHSREVCYVLSQGGLLKLIVDTFLPVDLPSEGKFKQLLAIKALKFIRIIAKASREVGLIQEGANTIIIEIPNSVIKPLETYYYVDCYSLSPDHQDNLFILHIESLRLMKVLAMMNEFTQEIFTIIAMNPDFLRKNFKALSSLKSNAKISSRISLDWQYAAHLIDITGYIMSYERLKSTKSLMQYIWSTFVRPLAGQWLNDLIEAQSIPHLDVSIAVVTAMNYFGEGTEQDDRVLLNLALKSVDPVKDPHANPSLSFFNCLAQSAATKSELNELLSKSGRLRDPKMLPSFGCLNYNLSKMHQYQLNNVVENNSPFILLNMFIGILNKEKPTRRESLKLFANNLNLIRYIRLATNYYKLPLKFELAAQQSILAQCEVQLIASSLLLLGGYYLTTLPGDNLSSGPEPSELRDGRLECYSQLLFDAISIVSLIQPHAPHLVDLKDQLLIKIILNIQLHVRLPREIFSNQRDYEPATPTGLDKMSGKEQVQLIMDSNLNILRPVYMSCELPTRFWLYQPLIEYYHDQILSDKPDKSEARNGFWFVDGITDQHSAYPDTDIVSEILNLGAAIMFHSSAYNSLAIRPNIQEHLCLVASIFLDDDLFLSEKVSRSIKNYLSRLSRECLEAEYELFSNASTKIETLNITLADFFTKIVDQFEAASYCDINFSNFLLLFMTSTSDKMFKKKLFSEKADTCLSQIRLRPEDVWAPESLFFNRREEDSEIKMLLFKAGSNIHKGTFLDKYRQFHITK